MRKNVAIIILAAGLGTRMKSNRAKVLHELLGKPMINYVVEAAVKVVGRNVIIVVGHQAEIVKKTVSDIEDVIFAYQERQLGTGHAAMCAMPYLPENIEKTIILCGDVPLLSSKTINQLLENHENEKCDISLLAVTVENPTGYGRVIVDADGNVMRIIEEADASPAEKQIKLINSGIYCINRGVLEKSLHRISSDNAQDELYLTDIIEIGRKDEKKIKLLISGDYEEITGVNCLNDLIEAENILKRRQSKTS